MARLAAAATAAGIPGAPTPVAAASSGRHAHHRREGSATIDGAVPAAAPAPATAAPAASPVVVAAPPPGASPPPGCEGGVDFAAALGSILHLADELGGAAPRALRPPPQPRPPGRRAWAAA